MCCSSGSDTYELRTWQTSHLLSLLFIRWEDPGVFFYFILLHFRQFCYCARLRELYMKANCSIFKLAAVIFFLVLLQMFSLMMNAEENMWCFFCFSLKLFLTMLANQGGGQSRVLWHWVCVGLRVILNFFFSLVLKNSSTTVDQPIWFATDLKLNTFVIFFPKYKKVFYFDN